MIASPTHIPVRPEWLATHEEEVLDPPRPVVDSHHHLYDRPGSKYLLDDYLRDVCSGHNVRASVFVQARSMLRADAPPHLQPVGETEFANGVAAMSASGIYGEVRVCAGIVGFADITLGDAVRPVLERHIAAAGGSMTDGGRFCGIRQTLSWDADRSLLNPAYSASEHMIDSQAFRAGIAHLAPLGLSFEAWAFFHQLPKIATLARTFPETQIVLNHCGGVVRIARYSGQRDEVFRRWKIGLAEVARCPNVMVKLSGLGMRLGGFGFEDRDRAPTSVELADTWRPWIEGCIEAFGTKRSMYGSNFPVDKGSYSYKSGLNALKRLACGASEDEKDDIFWRTAKRFYRLPETSLRIAPSSHQRARA
jgi:predicted TIM-barrel fold metal-dependent hydrolase